MRQDAGLGDPPTQYTTNRNESINRVVQHHCSSDFTYSTWVQFGEKLYDLIVNRPFMEWENKNLRKTTDILKLKVLDSLS